MRSFGRRFVSLVLFLGVAWFVTLVSVAMTWLATAPRLSAFASLVAVTTCAAFAAMLCLLVPVGAQAFVNAFAREG